VAAHPGRRFGLIRTAEIGLLRGVDRAAKVPYIPLPASIPSFAPQCVQTDSDTRAQNQRDRHRRNKRGNDTGNSDRQNNNDSDKGRE